MLFLSLELPKISNFDYRGTHKKKQKKDTLIKIKEAKAIYHRSGISAEEIYEISKKEYKGNQIKKGQVKRIGSAKTNLI
jgi:hypothetical protein